MNACGWRGGADGSLDRISVDVDRPTVTRGGHRADHDQQYEQKIGERGSVLGAHMRIMPYNEKAGDPKTAGPERFERIERFERFERFTRRLCASLPGRPASSCRRDLESAASAAP